LISSARNFSRVNRGLGRRGLRCFAALVIDYFDPNGLHIGEGIRNLWMPGLVCSALFYRGGVHDGNGFVYLAVIFNVAIYTLVIFALLKLVAAVLSRRRL